MKRSGFDHPKVRRLARHFRIPLCYARGILESLWHWTAVNAPQGDVGKWTDQDIAEGIGWAADPGELVRGLVETRWLDGADDTRRLLVHDWFDHAEDSVHSALARARLWFADGQVPKLTRLGKDERKAIQTFYHENRPPHDTAPSRAVSPPERRAVTGEDPQAPAPPEDMSHTPGNAEKRGETPRSASHSLSSPKPSPSTPSPPEKEPGAILPTEQVEPAPGPGTSPSDSGSLEIETASASEKQQQPDKLAIADTARAILQALKLKNSAVAGSPQEKQLKADVTCLRIIAGQIVAGHLGPWLESRQRCTRKAAELAASPTIKNRLATFLAWFKADLAGKGHVWNEPITAV